MLLWILCEYVIQKLLLACMICQLHNKLVKLKYPIHSGNQPTKLFYLKSFIVYSITHQS